MKNLKFRQRLKESLWHKGEKFHYWGFIDNVFISPVGKNNSLSESEQFTGLKDTDGKEIFEGDIAIDRLDGIEKRVVFRNGCFKLMFKSWNGKILYCHISPTGSYAAVGNVYDNPELMEHNQHV